MFAMEDLKNSCDFNGIKKQKYHKPILKEEENIRTRRHIKQILNLTRKVIQTIQGQIHHNIKAHSVSSQE
jgi:hypothetical protein